MRTQHRITETETALALNLSLFELIALHTILSVGGIRKLSTFENKRVKANCPIEDRDFR